MTTTTAEPAPVEETEEEKPVGLWAKVHAVQTETQAVEKTGKVDFGNTHYTHFQEHGLLAQLKPLFSRVGLVVVPGVESYVREGNSAVLNFKLTVIDPDTGDQHTEFFPNEGVDQSDKAFNKAYTGAMKYALQKFFLIPTDTVDEQEGSDDHHNQTRDAGPARGQANGKLGKRQREQINDALHDYIDKGLGMDRLELKLVEAGAKNTEDLDDAIASLDREKGKGLYEWLVAEAGAAE